MKNNDGFLSFLSFQCLLQGGFRSLLSLIRWGTEPVLRASRRDGIIWILGSPPVLVQNPVAELDKPCMASNTENNPKSP